MVCLYIINFQGNSQIKFGMYTLMGMFISGVSNLISFRSYFLKMKAAESYQCTVIKSLK